MTYEPHKDAPNGPSTDRMENRILPNNGEKWRSFVMQAPNYMIVADRSGTIQFVNRVPPPHRQEEFIGKSIYAFIHPEHAPLVRSTIEQVFETGNPGNYEVIGYEVDGSEHWFSTSVGLLIQGGNPVAVSLVSTDITASKQAVYELWKSQEYYRTMVEDMPALVCRFLPNGELTFVNPHYCQYFNTRREDLIGQNFFQFIPKEDRSNVREHYASLTQENPAITYEHKVIAPNGAIRWQRWTDRAIFNELGQPIEYQSIGEDITERKQVEEAEHVARLRSESLRQAMAALTSELDLDQVLNSLMVHLEKVIPYEIAFVLLREGKTLYLKASKGLSHQELVDRFDFSTETPLLQEIYFSGDPLVLPDAQAEPRFRTMSDLDTVHAWMGVPLRLRGEVIGYLVISSSTIAAYAEPEARLAQTFADQASIAIENARLYQQAHQLSITDPLTGMFNRRHFFDLARREYERSLRYDHALSVIMIDIDRFKQVNDAHGHAIGDKVLQLIARRLSENLRGLDVLGRYGGDEFVILTPETGLVQARQVARRLRKSIARISIDATGISVKISASLGVAAIDSRCKDLDTLLTRADQALYNAKETGRNKVCVWRS